MKTTVKHVDYTSVNSYETRNKLTSKTKNVWIVFHGIGYLSRYFLAHFDALPPQENYIIAPQAPSKYYLNNRYTYVGASWLTKEDTEQELQNVLAYVQAVWEQEELEAKQVNLIVMGFSQGVSIATRWLARSGLTCHTLLLYAGALPQELQPRDMAHLLEHGTRIVSLIGDKDAYLTPARLKEEEQKLQMLFQGKVEKVRFSGGHEVKNDLLKEVVYGS